MKRIFLVCLLLCSVSLAFSQRHEIGIQGGMNNLVGDIGKSNYLFSQDPFSNTRDGIPVTLAISYKRNFNAYQGVRVGIHYGHLMFNDEYAIEADRNKRNVFGTNTVLGIDADFVYNFLPINDEQKVMVSPYLFGGLGYAMLQTVANTSLVSTGSSSYVGTIAIPFGVGIKYKFDYNWSVLGELKFKYFFTDGLDFSDLPINKGLENYYGNKNSNDWINAITLGVSYSFGRPPCDCQ